MTTREVLSATRWLCCGLSDLVGWFLSSLNYFLKFFSNIFWSLQVLIWTWGAHMGLWFFSPLMYVGQLLSWTILIWWTFFSWQTQGLGWCQAYMSGNPEPTVVPPPHGMVRGRQKEAIFHRRCRQNRCCMWRMRSNIRILDHLRPKAHVQHVFKNQCVLICCS